MMRMMIGDYDDLNVHDDDDDVDNCDVVDKNTLSSCWRVRGRERR